MTDLLLQPTGSPTQYEVIADAQIVGRITLSSSLRNHSEPWVWSIDLAFSHGGDPVHGRAAAREAAMHAFARSWFGENLGAFL
jgi:hypothetical protein